MRARVSRVTMVVLLAAMNVGCYAWVTPPGSPADALRERSSRGARLLLADSSRVSLEAVEVRGDSVYGHELGAAARSETGAERVIPVADVREVRVRIRDRVAEGIIGVALLFAGTTALIIAMPPLYDF